MMLFQRSIRRVTENPIAHWLRTVHHAEAGGHIVLPSKRVLRPGRKVRYSTQAGKRDPQRSRGEIPTVYRTKRGQIEVRTAYGLRRKGPAEARWWMEFLTPTTARGHRTLRTHSWLNARWRSPTVIRTARRGNAAWLKIPSDAHDRGYPDHVTAKRPCWRCLCQRQRGFPALSANAARRVLSASATHCTNTLQKSKLFPPGSC